MREVKDLKIAVAGTGYVGLSIATLLSQDHKVTAVDIIPEKVELINNKKSPIQDEYIEKYYSHEDAGYFGGPSWNFYVKLMLGYYYGIWGNKLDIFLKDIGLEDII